MSYHIVANTREDKYTIIDMIRTAGAVLTGVSGYGSGYYIQFDATPHQAGRLQALLEEIA